MPLQQLPPLDPARAREDKSSASLAVITIVSSLSTLFVVARLWVRIKVLRQLQFDDFMIVAAVISGWLSVGFSAAAVHSGSGRHIQTLSIEQIQGSIFYTFVGFLPGILSIILPKLAVVHLLSRLLNPSRPHLIWLWSINVILLFCLLVTIGLVFGQCQPANSQWDFSVPMSVYTAVSAFVDLYLAIYPGIVLYTVQIPKKKKIALSAALGIGSLSIIVAIYRITDLHKLASVDVTYDHIDLATWTIVEGSVIIIAACIPLLQPLLEKIRNRPWITEDTSQDAHPTPSGRHGYADLNMSDDRSRIRKLRRKFEMDSILATKNKDEEYGVIGRAAGNRTRSDWQPAEPNLKNDANSIPLEEFQGFYRTDEVHITYGRDEQSGAKPHRHQNSWS